MRKKKNVKVIEWLNTGIFRPHVLFNMNFSYSELISELKKLKADTWITGISTQADADLINGSWCAMRRDIENKTTKETLTLYYISLNTEFGYSDTDYISLAHEVLHITQFMLKDYLDRDREYECEAYLHSHLMRQALKVIRG